MVLYNVFQHKTTGQYFAFLNIPETPQHRSIRVLKNTLRRYKKKWSLFLVCTYKDEYIDGANSDDMRKFINNIKQYTRNKINKYRKLLEKSNLDLEKKNFFRIRLDNYQWKLKNMMYYWKAEFESDGARDYNPHFHVLMYVPFWLKLKRIQKYWKFGSLHLESIKTSKKASIYVSKYFSKETKHFTKWEGKHWSKSRNIKTYKNFCRFVKQMPYQFAMRLVELTKRIEPNGYQIDRVFREYSKFQDWQWVQQLKYLLIWKSKLK